MEDRFLMNTKAHFSGTTYRNGADLFFRNHREEWYRVAIHYALEREFWRDDFRRRPKLDELPEREWTTDHELFARCIGRDDAVIQVDEMIDVLGEAEFKQRLTDIPWFRKYVNLFWPLALSLALALAFIYRAWTFLRKPKVPAQNES